MESDSRCILIVFAFGIVWMFLRRAGLQRGQSFAAKCLNLPRHFSFKLHELHLQEGEQLRVRKDSGAEVKLWTDIGSRQLIVTLVQAQHDNHN